MWRIWRNPQDADELQCFRWLRMMGYGSLYYRQDLTTTNAASGGF
jgi:uncharacterized protein with PIN domain